jgi:sugar phosphate permease
MRFLVGLLVLHLAFALKRDELGSVGLGVLVAAAAAGTLLGALLAPRARGVLHEEGMLVSSLALSGIAGIAAGRWFSVASAAALVFVVGVASGAGKVGFDSIVQRDVPEAGRGWAFARFESILQLTWVMGAAIPLVVTLPSGPGVMGAGALALVMAVFVGAVGLRARSTTVTRTPSSGGPPPRPGRDRTPLDEPGPD